jgi:hypothetical protein
MVVSKYLFEYKDSLLDTMICKRLDTLLLAANKYNTLPVGILQLIVSKINLQPVMVLVIYDDKVFMNLLSRLDDKIDLSIANASIDSVTPTLILFPTEFEAEDVIYNYNDLFFYASTYLVDLQRVREGLKNKMIDRYALYTNTSERKRVICNIECKENIGLIKLPEDNYIKLPFRNITKYNKMYENIISKIMNNDAIATFNEIEAETIYEEVKEKQIADVNGICVFKDFIKQKPLNLIIYASIDNGVKTVCLKMGYKTSKLTHMVFYRYIGGIFNKITGSIEEVKTDNGN